MMGGENDTIMINELMNICMINGLIDDNDGQTDKNMLSLPFYAEYVIIVNDGL